mgnify:CR=1 FL=1
MKNFINNIVDQFQGKLFKSEGRASRSEYWQYWLFTQSSLFFLLYLSFRFKPILILVLVAIIFLSVPSIFLTIRRLHDVNKSGYWLVGFLPFVLAAYLSIFLLSILSPDNQSSGTNFFQIIFLTTYIVGITATSIWYCFPILVFLTQKGDKEQNKYGSS